MTTTGPRDSPDSRAPGAPGARAAAASATMSSVAKATCCGSATAGPHCPRRSTDTLRHSRSEQSALATARLRTSPNGAATSEACCVRRPSRDR